MGFKATPHNHRLPPLPHICLQIFRHIAQNLLDVTQIFILKIGKPVSVLSNLTKKSDFASARQWLYGVVLEIKQTDE